MAHDASHGFLIRFGQPQNPSLPTRSTLPIMYIPSPILENLNVEFLVGAVADDQNIGVSVPAETFLVPAVGVPTAFDGRQVTVNQPVHHALITSEGFDELLSAIQLVSATKFMSQADRSSITIASDLHNVQSASKSESHVKVVDVSKAEEGLAAIRESVSKATIYEHKWIASGLPQLNQWLEETACQTQSTIPASQVTSLVQSIVESTKASLDEEELRLQNILQGRKLDNAVISRTESAIDDFSRAGHQELQAGLASAWSSRNWTKLSWYKLFWRVDDVGLIVSDLVNNTWLPRTERAAYEICGRLSQLGIDPVLPVGPIDSIENRPVLETHAAAETVSEPSPAVVEVAGTNPANEVTFVAAEPVLKTMPISDETIVSLRRPAIPQPIATAVSSARNAFLAQQTTILTTTAQQLVFRTLSISGMSGGLSFLTYASQLAPTVYEAGSLFAVGTVFALYRMQSGWQNATKALETGLFEEGKDVVRRVVTRMKELLDIRRNFREPDTVEVISYNNGVAALDKVNRVMAESKKRDEKIISSSP